MSSILIFIGILLFLVVAHELGHFTVAKLSGIKVLEFGVGIPPKAFSIQRGETTYSVNWLPIGGFVRMLGEEDPTDPRSFSAQSAFKRLAVLIAGPGVNALLPIILLTIALMIPQQIDITNVTVMSVIDGSPAMAAGVQPGDIIREADGRTVDNSNLLITGVQRRLGANITWVVEREGRMVVLPIAEVRIDPPEGEGATGITLTDARVTVASVQTGSTAAHAGLLPGDLFLRVADARVLFKETPQAAAAQALELDPTAPVDIEVLRQGHIVELALDAALGGLAGYTADVIATEQQSKSLWEAVPGAFQQTWDILVIFRNELARLITGASEFQLSGPVGIARITDQVAEAGLSPLITWAALLSINLAIVNILPFPALDGGRITFVLLELVRGGRRLAPERERMVHLVGFALLMTLILLVSINDIQRLISGSSPLG
jgi:regulator of sigma E protease